MTHLVQIFEALPVEGVPPLFLLHSPKSVGNGGVWEERLHPELGLRGLLDRLVVVEGDEKTRHLAAAELHRLLLVYVILIKKLLL